MQLLHTYGSPRILIVRIYKLYCYEGQGGGAVEKERGLLGPKPPSGSVFGYSSDSKRTTAWSEPGTVMQESSPGGVGEDVLSSPKEASMLLVTLVKPYRKCCPSLGVQGFHFRSIMWATFA